MSFSLKQALLLSSQNRAYSYIKDFCYPLFNRFAYRIMISHKESVILAISRVTYPDDKMQVADPHGIIEKATLGEMDAYLDEYGLDPSGDWMPLEPEA